MKAVEVLLDLSGIGDKRLCIRWVSAAEGRLFAEYATWFTEQTARLGPFDPAAYEIELAAVEKALASPRLRWLMGMELRLTQGANVYGEHLTEERYHRLLHQTAEEEYQSALVSTVIEKQPSSVREIAFLTGLPVYTVSHRLGELETHHKTEIKCFEGTTPKFAATSTGLR